MNETTISPGIKAIDLGLYLPEHKTFVFSDFHIGFEEELTSKGALLPRFQFKDTIDRLTKIFQEKENIEKIIINGDLKHEFGDISDQEWREILKLFDYFDEKANETIIVKGNHDPVIKPITEKRDVELVIDYKLDDILISHGDETPSEERLEGINTILIGHEHPAIGMRENQRKEKFKCFLKGEWKNKDLIVQPSFNPIREGSDMLKNNTLSPFLKKGVNDFEAWIIAREGEILNFGKIKNI